jgi:hypothetical protein
MAYLEEKNMIAEDFKKKWYEYYRLDGEVNNESMKIHKIQQETRKFMADRLRVQKELNKVGEEFLKEYYKGKANIYTHTHTEEPFEIRFRTEKLQIEAGKELLDYNILPTFYHLTIVLGYSQLLHFIECEGIKNNALSLGYMHGMIFGQKINGGRVND